MAFDKSEISVEQLAVDMILEGMTKIKHEFKSGNATIHIEANVKVISKEK